MGVNHDYSSLLDYRKQSKSVDRFYYGLSFVAIVLSAYVCHLILVAIS